MVVDERFRSDTRHKDPDTALALGFFLGPFGLLYLGAKPAALGFAILLFAVFAFGVASNILIERHVGAIGTNALRIGTWVLLAVGFGLYARREARRLNDAEFDAAHPGFRERHAHLTR